MDTLTEIFTFQAPTTITFGAGALRQLAQVVGPLGRRPLVVTDPGIAASGILQQVVDALAPVVAGVETFSDVEPNPSSETVERAAAAYRRADCDCLVAAGGGSAMDVAKVAAALVSYGGAVRDYEGVGKVPGPTVPVVAVPTTAGTGSEVTVFAIITDRARKVKMVIGSPHILPAAAVCDPLLTLSMPQPLTAATGIDALVHGIECYINTVVNPLAKSLALESIRLIGRSLRTAYAHGRDLEARYQMLLGSTIAALAFTRTRLGNVHAMALPLGAHFDVPHGVATGLLLPYVMEWNLIACTTTYPQIAAALGEPTEGLPPRAASEVAVEAVRQLNADIGIPERLRDVGVTRDAMPALADDSMKSGNIAVNPRLTRREDIVHLFEQAF
ncbi:MAG: iron-containing alcohol dehydrogenase [Armatimonadetes bacterium]|nr:iron-containing alcohol dehydrogenase [Armatimonadota bacterium]